MTHWEKGTENLLRRQLQNAPTPISGHKLPQKYSKVSIKIFINISAAAKPKRSTFQVLLEVQSSFHNKNKI